jgi:predicted permease
MFSHLLFNVLCIFVMMLPGFIAVKCGIFSRSTITELSRILINFIYPCFIFYSIINCFTFNELVGRWTLPAGSLGIMVAGYMIGLVTVRFIGFKTDDEKKSFLFQSLLNNYSFLPLPLVILLFGEKGGAALIFSSFGAELSVWTLGVFILHGHQFSMKNLTHLLTPPMISLYCAVLFSWILGVLKCNGCLAGYENLGSYANYTLNTFKMIGGATIPLAMIVAGARIAMIDFSGFNNARIWVLTFLRLIAIPLTVLSILKLIGLPEDTEKILMVVAVMPTSIASIMMSEIYGGDKEFMTVTVVSSHLLSIITIPVLLSLYVH